MPLDSSIVSRLQPVQLPDPMNRLAQVMQIQGAQNQNAMAQYGLAKAQRQDAQMNALMSALQGGGLDLNTPEGQARAFSLAPESAGPIVKNMMEARQAQSTIGKNDAEAGKFGEETIAKRTQFYGDQLGSVTNPQQAADWLRAQSADPVLGKVMSPQAVQAATASIPSDPAGFERWRNQAALGMTKYIELNAPKTSVVNSGATTQLVQTPGLGGAPTIAGTIQNTQSPDNAASNATRLQAVNIEQAGANKRNAATIAAENLRAGIGPDGSMPDIETTARAIANGQLPPPSGMALTNPKNQRILSRVMEINPNYDYTSITAKKAAATAFTSGKEGAMMRSLQVAGQHLDQLGELADAMNNGNMQLVNKIGNIVSQQTGSPAITNFDAAKEVVSKEVMKAIVAGGGGVGEREELARTLSNAKSPAQLKGVITQYRNLMAAQHDALLQQRDAAGLSRSTLPNYTEPGGGAGGMPPMSAIDAELARRAGR